MKNTDLDLKVLIFDLMNGSLDLEQYPVKESKIVKNEFEEGAFCAKAYNQIFDASCRLCRRLGVEEDKDIEIILDNFERIIEHMAVRMYEYGSLFSDIKSGEEKESV